MNQFNRLRFLFTLGISSTQKSSEKRDIIFTNQAIFVLLISSLCIALANWIAGCHLRIIVPLTTFCLLFYPVYLQKIREFGKAKFFAILLPFFAAILSTTLFGPLAKTQFYLGATLVLGLVIFQGIRNHLVLFLIHLIAIGSLQVWILTHSPYFSHQDSLGLGIFNLIFIANCVFITLAQFKVHYHKYEQKVNELVQSVQQQALELQARNQQIKHQANCMQAINFSLQKEVSEKEVMERQLINSNEELERFAYVASHDLKEPLRTIGSFTQILHRQLVDKVNEEEKEYFRFVIDGVKRMAFLLDDLLALSRLNRDFSVSSINLNNVLEIIHLNLKQQITQHKGKLVVAPLPTIIGNKTQIIQLFQNLISNGFKFVGKTPPIVEITCQELDDSFQFQIKDNGIGISPKFKEQIFIIFKRLHTRDKYQGTGIGLAICKKVVKNHGGKIWLESEEGIGTTMFFTIKKKPREPAKKFEQTAVVEA